MFAQTVAVDLASALFDRELKEDLA